MITALLVLALARTRRGQRCLTAVTTATANTLAPTLAALTRATVPIVVELAQRGRRLVRPHRRH